MATLSAVLSSPAFSPRALAHNLQNFLTIHIPTKDSNLVCGRPTRSSKLSERLTVGICMAGSRGVEPHPVSENLVFKASRRTNPAALLPKDTTLMHLVYRFVKRTTTIALGFILVRFQLWPRLRAWFAWLVVAWPLLPNPSKCLCCATLN